jgi:murein DD-endopeptidase MepM/ murein hydrolase activator NlpD
VKKNQFRYHYGTDYRASIGTPVYSMAKGIIVFQKFIPLFGETVIVNHGDNIFSFYLHLSSYRKHLGDTVFSGEYIAKSGNTGARKLPPHLHFGVSVEKVSVNWRSFKQVFLTKRLALKKPAFFIWQNSVPWYSWVFSNSNLNTSRPGISLKLSKSSVKVSKKA